MDFRKVYYLVQRNKCKRICGDKEWGYFKWSTVIETEMMCMKSPEAMNKTA